MPKEQQQITFQNKPRQTVPSIMAPYGMCLRSSTAPSSGRKKSNSVPLTTGLLDDVTPGITKIPPIAATDWLGLLESGVAPMAERSQLEVVL